MQFIALLCVNNWYQIKTNMNAWENMDIREFKARLLMIAQFIKNVKKILILLVIMMHMTNKLQIYISINVIYVTI